VYVADVGNNAVKKIPVGGGAPVTVGYGFYQPFGVAVDAAGNVYVADAGNNAVKKIPVGGGVLVSLGSGFSFPKGIAVDYAGNLYVADISGVKEIKPTGGYHIGPFLPPGLSFDENTGIISGTPTKASPATNYTVTAYHSFGSASATVIIKVLLPNNANLSSLQLSSGTLSPSFASGTTGYTASVATDTTSVTLTPTTVDPLAMIKVNGKKVTSGAASAVIPLVYGPNTITTVVTAQDGTTIKTYTLTLTRAPLTALNNAHLKALQLSSGTLSPVFIPGKTNYTASVSNSTKSITITPTTSNALATVTVNGIPVASGTASASLPLAIGPNTITTIVTAQDGITTRTYTVIVTRISDNANLAWINLNGLTYTLTPDFSPEITSYTANVNPGITSIRITPTTIYPTATLTVNGMPVTSGTASSAIPLSEGSNTITIFVTALDGITTNTYTVTVTRAPSNNANLAWLSMSEGPLSPGFAAATTSYTASVTNATTSIRATPFTGDAAATVKVNGITVSSGTASAAIPLSVGPNIITLIGTAQDGVTTKTYTVTVTRAPSSIANLSSIQLSSGTLSPVFAVATTSYTASVSNATTSITVTPTTGDPTATVTVNGTAVTSGTASAAIPLTVGPNAITLIGTAQDGVTTKTYTVTVTRISNNAKLAWIKLSSGTLSPGFAEAATSYTASVTNTTTSITVTPTAVYSTTTITVNGTAVTSGTASPAIPLTVGTNVITLIGTAQDGVTTKTYTVTVTRISSNAKLALIHLSSGTLSPTFAAATTSYTASVTNATTSITVTPTAVYSTSTIKVNGTAVSSGTASGSIALAIGPNTITLVCTAQDGVTKMTYSVTVTRATGPVPIATPQSYVENTMNNLPNDGIVVHQGVSPNGDGANDILTIDGIVAYPDNKLMIMNRSGELVFEAKGYDNSSKVFDGHSNKNGKMQQAGTYFYSLEYKVGGVTKNKTGFIVLKW
jgi:gliding motility-associated-like protein